MNAADKKADDNIDAIEYIKDVISKEVRFSGASSTSLVNIELSINKDGEMSVIGMDLEDETLKKQLKAQIEQIVFPGIEEIHGKVVTCTLRLETI